MLRDISTFQREYQGIKKRHWFPSKEPETWEILHLAVSWRHRWLFNLSFRLHMVQEEKGKYWKEGTGCGNGFVGEDLASSTMASASMKMDFWQEMVCTSQKSERKCLLGVWRALNWIPWRKATIFQRTGGHKVLGSRTSLVYNKLRSHYRNLLMGRKKQDGSSWRE